MLSLVQPCDHVVRRLFPSWFRHDVMREAVILRERRAVLVRQLTRDAWYHEAIIAPRGAALNLKDQEMYVIDKVQNGFFAFTLDRILR